MRGRGSDEKQYEAFMDRMGEFADAVGADRRPAFTLPVAACIAMGRRVIQTPLSMFH